MADAKESKLICVTGASGYIASHIIQQLLEQGHRVRGVVRDLSKKEKLSHFDKFPRAASHLELVEADLQGGKYPELLKGCDILIHTATPYFYTAQDPEKEIVQPAIKGTEDAINGAIAAGVKRVVITSSGGAIVHFPVPANYVFTAKDWNNWSSLQNNPYFYSKRLAEQAAWALYEANKDKVEVVVVNPLFVIGPTLNANLNTSLKTIRSFLMGEQHKIQAGCVGLVDVRDAAAAHVLAAFHPKAVGQRLIAHGASLSWADMYGKFKQMFPKYPLQVDDAGPAHPISFDSTPLMELGFPGFRDVDTMVRDTVNSFVELGVVPDLRS